MLRIASTLDLSAFTHSLVLEETYESYLRLL